MSIELYKLYEKGKKGKSPPVTLGSYGSFSFEDVTNAVPNKRRNLPPHTQPDKASSVVTVDMFEELSAKVDLVSQKVDAIYELLQAIHQRPVLPTSPMPMQLVSMDVVPPHVDTEGRHMDNMFVTSLPFNNPAHLIPASAKPADNPIILLDQQQQQQQPQQQQQQQQQQPVVCVEEKAPCEHRKSSSFGGGGDNPSWMKRNCFIVLVEFKCQRIKRCEADDFISPGQYAIVQGDRGHDCGVVNQCSEWDAEKCCFVREESFDGNLVNLARMKNDLGRVERVASEEEVERLFGEIARNENLALKTCREIVARLGLDMEVVDCEYQFDQQKISFYYEAFRSIDFRQLNSELYRIFGVRIWLQNVNNAVKNVVPPGAMSRLDKTQFQKSGLRPPAFK